MKTFYNLGLVGHPLGHSLSPQIHKAALDACALEGDYSLFLVHPNDLQGLKNLLKLIRRGEIAGLNVTIPHKQTLISLLDEITPTAQEIGAINTISLQSGKLIGDNTDAPGFLADLHKFLTTETPRPPGPRGGAGTGERQRRDERRLEEKKIGLVLGAGGSARAVVYALINAGWDVILSARRREQAQELIAQYSTNNYRISFIDYQTTSFQSLVLNLSLIVNTMPLGMSPDTDSSPWPEGLPFPPNAAVYDLVYNPRETKLVKDARAAGRLAATGLGMLIEQAALSFEIWTGHTPPREVLWKAIEN